jgi:hypothetical protein
MQVEASSLGILDKGQVSKHLSCSRKKFGWQAEQLMADEHKEQLEGQS